MQRILDVHVCREKTTQNVYLSDVNRYFMTHIKEEVFMRLRQINTRDAYLRILFESLWSKKEFTNVKTETKALVGQWLKDPELRQKFPYSLLKPDTRSYSRQRRNQSAQRKNPSIHLMHGTTRTTT